MSPCSWFRTSMVMFYFLCYKSHPYILKIYRKLSLILKAFYKCLILFCSTLFLFSPSQIHTTHYTAAACPTLCDPVDSSPPGSPVPGILQARTLEWGAISFSNLGKWKVKAKSLSRVRLFATPWAAAYRAPLSMGFSRQEHWSGVPLPSPTHYTGVVKIK